MSSHRALAPTASLAVIGAVAAAAGASARPALPAVLGIHKINPGDLRPADVIDYWRRRRSMPQRSHGVGNKLPPAWSANKGSLTYLTIRQPGQQRA